MAENQPVTPTAPTAPEPQTPAPVPATNPAEQQPATPPTLELSDDQKSYLKGQGLTDADLTAPDALAKIISHAQSSQRTAAQIKADYDKVKNLVAPAPEATNPFGVPAQPTTPTSETAPTQTPAPQPAAIDNTTAYLVSSNLAAQYPDLAEDITGGKLYNDMAALGIPLTTSNGLNLQGIQQFAAMRQNQVALEKQIEVANTPGESAIPPVTPTTPQQPAADFVMDKQKAQALFVQKAVSHPRYAEALQFLQSNK